MFVADKQKDTLLYAGTLKLRITDWFIFKDKADVKYIGLEDAVIKLQRTKDSIWNYQFIADYFASDKPKQNKSGGIDLNIKKIDLKNIRFVNNDRWVGEEIIASIKNLEIDAEKIDFAKSILNLNEIIIETPIIEIENYEALRKVKPLPNPNDDTASHLNPDNLQINLAKLTITNGQFIDNVVRDIPLPSFDGSHLHFKNINTTIQNLRLFKDTLTATLNISCKEKSGLEVKQLAAKCTINPTIMEFDSLELRTNRSYLSNYYAMQFRHFNNDFAEYVTNVTMVANFKNNSNIHTNDLAFFAPDLSKLNRNIELYGNFKGTVANFTINNLMAKTGNSSIAGNLTMNGLPEFDKTLITLNNGTINTNVNDVAIIAPILKTFNNPDLEALGNIKYKGTFTGYHHNFKAIGNINTNLGTFYTNINLQFPPQKESIYSGTITASRFNLGRFIRNNTIGYIDFDGKVDGTSFTLEKMKTKLEGNVRSFDVNNYTYTNTTINGTFEKRAFFGELKIDDPNLALLGSVQVDFSDSLPRFNLFSDITKSNYKELNLTKDNVSLTGTIDVNFIGNNIDNFFGEAKILNGVLVKDNDEIKFDEIKLTSGYENNLKFLQLNAADINAKVTGEFSILDLPASFQSFLHKYYPAYIAEPGYIPKNQDFNFEVTTNLIEPYLQLIDHKIKGFNDAVIAGNINTKENTLNTTIYIPHASYNNIILNGIDINAKGTIDSLFVMGSVNKTIFNDSLNLPESNFTISSSNDHSILNLQTKASNTLNDASLIADVYTLEDGVRVQFQPSSFVINEKKWNIEKGGEFIARSNFLSTKKLKLTQGFQEININTYNEEETNATNVVIQFDNLVMGDFVGYAVKDPKLEAVVKGKIEVNDIFNQLTATAGIYAEGLRVDEDSIGKAEIIAGYNDKLGKITWNINSPNKNYNFFAKGSYNLKDSIKSTNQPENDSKLYNEIYLNGTQIKPLEKYLKGLFSNLEGLAFGSLKIYSNNDDIVYKGDVQLKQAGILVDYTQVYYTIDSALIKFEEDGINFGSFTIKDKYGNTGNVKGKLFEKNFANMVFDFDLSTPKLLLLNTQSKDNQQFYGNAIGRATLSFKGPETNAKMLIVGAVNDTSHIYIPNSTSRESADADFIVFREYGEEMEQIKNQSAFNLSVDLDLSANEKATIDVILDELTGDVIKATGNGRLRIKAGTNEKLDIRGRYNIQNGKYDFNFQSLIKRPFILLPDKGSFIEWNGDPFNADIHIDAQYEADNVSLADLINNSSGLFGANDNALRAQRGPVYVIAELRDKLTQPKIKFKIDFPQNSPAKTDPNFAQFLNRIEKDDNEMLTQATSLIVFNAFAPYGQGLLGRGSGGGFSATNIVANSISQQLFAVVNKSVTNLFQRLFKDKSLKIDLGTSVYSSGNVFNSGINATSDNRIDRSRFNFKIGKSFLNNNIIVTFGGDIDMAFGATAAQSGNLQWLPDLNVEIILTKDRKLRAIIFNKNSLDINGSTFGQRNRQGVSISYRQEFNYIFGKPEEEIIAPTVPAIKVSKEKENMLKDSSYNNSKLGK